MTAWHTQRREAGGCSVKPLLALPLPLPLPLALPLALALASRLDRRLQREADVDGAHQRAGGVHERLAAELVGEAASGEGDCGG